MRSTAVIISSVSGVEGSGEWVVVVGRGTVALEPVDVEGRGDDGDDDDEGSFPQGRDRTKSDPVPHGTIASSGETREAIVEATI